MSATRGMIVASPARRPHASATKPVSGGPIMKAAKAPSDSAADIHRGGPVATGSGGGGRQRINQRHAEAECGEAGNDHCEAVADDDQHDADHRDRQQRRAVRTDPNRTVAQSPRKRPPAMKSEKAAYPRPAAPGDARITSRR